MKVLVDTPIWSYALRSLNKEYLTEIEPHDQDIAPETLLAEMVPL